jgi:hypothetical protein
MTDLRSLYSPTKGGSTVVSTPEVRGPVSHDEGRKLAEELRALYVECSARSDKESVENVFKTMLWLWHKSESDKKSRQSSGAGGCILQ